MFKTYLAMKKAEWKVKGQIYNAIGDIFDNHKELVAFAKNFYDALKDVSPDEMKDAIVLKVAEIASENLGNTESDK